MLQLSYIRDNANEIIERLKVRNFDGQEVIDYIVSLDKERRETQTKLDTEQGEMNKISKKIGELFKSGKRDEAEEYKAKTGELKEAVKKHHTKLNEIDEKLQGLLYQVPNVPNKIVPAGKSDADNEIIEEVGQKPTFDFEPKPHWDLAKEFELIDFELGNKITGAGFPLYTGKGARLQRALKEFFLNEAIEAGYVEVMPPLLVNEDTGKGTGQLPDKEGQMYHTELDHLFLIPTAEVPITNIYRDVIIKEDQFPIKHCGYTPCFRREAGSYGKDVRGLNRLHQFDKVEIVQVTHPEKSYEALDEMVSYVRSIIEKLELPYRVARLCGGDLGFTSALTYDMEVYSAAQDKWLEVSSISNFETFQANRLKARFKDKNGKMQLAHTLNGSALAFPRILAAILENNQTKDGINIPKALVPFTGFDKI
ncbi:serine--tRNA ligase [Salibacter halophilus]|uniref:Serine--tRNA ligase n=1 Tax=Salibacter halophilus TaxID=1803916 RepID=A0A6N6M2J6_9FLAO|nr:serine--tRNA ligase [Salibacter halophilus]KAB1063360.1 serine--tRNA ligase [Salibacter halophilus]